MAEPKSSASPCRLWRISQPQNCRKVVHLSSEKDASCSGHLKTSVVKQEQCRNEQQDPTKGVFGKIYRHKYFSLEQTVMERGDIPALNKSLKGV